MAFEKFDLENLDKERRKAVANSIRTMSVEENEGARKRNLSLCRRSLAGEVLPLHRRESRLDFSSRGDERRR